MSFYCPGCGKRYPEAGSCELDGTELERLAPAKKPRRVTPPTVAKPPKAAK